MRVLCVTDKTILCLRSYERVQIELKFDRSCMLFTDVEMMRIGLAIMVYLYFTPWYSIFAILLR